MMTNKLTMMIGALMLAGVAGTASRTEASERVFVGLNVGQPTYYASAPVVERTFVPGHYELRPETVVVEPERRVREWVAPGRYREIVTPARYETREVQVWVPGYYSDVAVGAPVVVHSRPSFHLGGFFRF